MSSFKFVNKINLLYYNKLKVSHSPEKLIQRYKTEFILMEDKNKLCIICASHTNEKDDHLASIKTLVSWKTLFEAAQIRNHTGILEVAKQLQEEEIPNIKYHRKCRSLFTLKRDLESLKRKANEICIENTDTSSSSKRLCRRSPSESRVYDAVCIFCNKVKFLKGSKSCETLTQAIQLRADKTLRDCATQKKDERILALTCRDIVAAEAHYHFSCYRNYTRGVKTKKHGNGFNQEVEYEKLKEKLIVIF